MNADYTEQGIDPESGLTTKQRLFCDHYLTHMNARKAFLEAGYAASTNEIARIEATKLLAIPSVSEWLKQKMAERSARLAIQADKVMQELNVICQSRITDYRLNPITGAVEVVPGVPLEYLAAVKSAKSHSTTTVKTVGQGDATATITETVVHGEIVLHDKLKALEMMCKHLGLTCAELPPLEVLLNRLPPHLSRILRDLLARPATSRPTVNMEEPPADEDKKSPSQAA